MLHIFYINVTAHFTHFSSQQPIVVSGYHNGQQRSKINSNNVYKNTNILIINKNPYSYQILEICHLQSLFPPKAKTKQINSKF